MSSNRHTPRQANAKSFAQELDEAFSLRARHPSFMTSRSTEISGSYPPARSRLDARNDTHQQCEAAATLISLRQAGSRGIQPPPCRSELEKCDYYNRLAYGLRDTHELLKRLRHEARHKDDYWSLRAELRESRIIIKSNFSKYARAVAMILLLKRYEHRRVIAAMQRGIDAIHSFAETVDEMAEELQEKQLLRGRRRVR